MKIENMSPLSKADISTSIEELATVARWEIEQGYMITGRDIPDDLLEVVINSQN